MSKKATSCRRIEYLCILHKLVRSIHLCLLLAVLLHYGLVERGVGRYEGNFLLPHDLLLLGGDRNLSFSGGIDIHGLLLLFDLLDVCTLEGHDAVDVKLGADLDAGGVATGGEGNLLRSEGAEPGVEASRKFLRACIGSLNAEGFLSVEGENFGGRNVVALWEHEKFGVIFGVRRGGLPVDADREVVDVRHRELSDAENGGKHGTCKGGTASDGLILVKGGGESFSRECVLDLGTDGGDTSGSTNELDSIDLLDGKAGRLDRSLDNRGDAVEEGLHKGLELLARQFGAGIDVVHQVFNIEDAFAVGRKNLLQLLAASAQTESRLW